MSDDQAAPLWEFVRLEDYSPPAAPAVERVQGGLGRLWVRLRGSKADEGRSERVVPEAPPSAVLDEAAPAPSWSGAIQALDAALGPWAEGGGSRDANVRVVVGPSHAAPDDIVGAWARSRRWKIIDPPGPEEILTGGKDWLAGVASSDRPRVLRRLDQLYLRHHDGLELVERLVERLSAGEERVLIGCGSWSWAYLTRALGIEVVLGRPLALQALDHQRLRDWFGQLAADRFDFRQRRESGEAVVLGERSPDRPPGSNGPKEDSDFLQRLAAFSRGIPLVAWAVWRDSLRMASDASATPPGNRATLWLPDWSELDLPNPAGALGPCELAVLHEVLLQGSTTTELLARLLPFSAAEFANGLHVLRRTGLLETGPDGWQVPRLGYPAARVTLLEAGYHTGSI